MKKFLERLHIPGTITQVGLANKILKVLDGEFDLTEFVKLHENENLFFLSGVDLFMGTGRAKDVDVEKRKYIVLDFDLRKDIGGSVSDDEIKQEGKNICKELDKHPKLKDWSYLIFSGNGIHVYYIGDAIECNEFYRTGVECFYNEVEKVLPYKPDPACANPSRILRLPLSYNNKKEKKLVEILEERDCEAVFMKDLLENGREHVEALKVKGAEVVQQFASATSNDKFKEINLIPVGPIVAKEMGWLFDGRDFTTPGKNKKKACFIPNSANIIVHGGTDHFSHEQRGYSPFEFIKMIRNLNNRDTFQYFEDEYPHIQDIAETIREEWKDNKNETKEIVAYEKSESVDSFTWGLDCIDEKITTPKKGRLLVLVSDENTGKSTFMFFVARMNHKKYGHNVVYFNLEQTKDEVVHDMALQYVKATKLEIRDNKYDNDPEFLARKKQLGEQEDVTFIGTKATELTTIESVEKQLLEMKGADMLILDNLSCLATESADKNEKVKQIILRLSNIAVQMNIPVVLVHHYRKKSAKQITIFRDVHDVGGSGAIKDLAHTIIQVARTPEPTTDIEESEFHIREGKLRGGAKKESICVIHDRGDFIKNPDNVFNF